MADKEKVFDAFRNCITEPKCKDCPWEQCEQFNQKKVSIPVTLALDILNLLKEQKSLLGIQQTADSITFISTDTAQQGEERGILLGKSLMHEWIYKELLCKGLLTDDIRSVFEQANRI